MKMLESSRNLGLPSSGSPLLSTESDESAEERKPLVEGNREGLEAGDCSRPLCPLNRVRAGIAVKIRQLCASPEVSIRLREIGFCENRIVRLLTSHNNIICLVCNARLALGEQLAQCILVEPLPADIAA